MLRLEIVTFSKSHTFLSLTGQAVLLLQIFLNLRQFAKFDNILRLFYKNKSSLTKHTRKPTIPCLTH
jgi:hypothetical protein